ncbi:riboflavin biosynthesis protein RibD [Nonomuraea diastatica]|uniref:Riboflavin biosynthesis protein RibD n=2 Tax=Nonomuraea diastatica TaxID=1848329 RepID=A0A4V2YCB9_9ACTN|nr:riboflavin biosynthesis protein RibD [Nonomuraea diastatica]
MHWDGTAWSWVPGSAYVSASGSDDQTGAVVMGRRSFDMADDPDWYVGNYEFQVPIFVLTHQPPRVTPKQDKHLTFTFVTDGVESAIAAANVAAQNKIVQVLGADVIQQVLRAGLVDELHVAVMPVLLGAGLRLFDSPGLENITLDKTGVYEIGAMTEIRFRISR